MKKRNLIHIIIQAFYGNRTHTEINPENIDSFILGHLEFKWAPKVDPESRVVVPVPNAEGIAIIYNKDEERKALRELEDSTEEEYVRQPLAEIPKLGLKIYSRCIVCRIDEAGEPDSLCPEDLDSFMHYLAR